jgi:hypothetical protein
LRGVAHIVGGPGLNFAEEKLVNSVS